MKTLKWFALGLGTGAAVAILYAPKAGTEMREMLRDKADDARRYVAGTIREEHYTIGDVIHEGKRS